MSIATEIERLQNAKASIKTAIENKGVVVGDGLIDTYASKIDEITGGGGSSDVKITDAKYLFYGGARLDYMNEILALCEKPTSADRMFQNAGSLKSIDLSSFDTSEVTSMEYMFSTCSNLTSVDMSSLNTAKVKHMGNLFSTCMNLTEVNLSGLNTSSVTNMSMMFQYCSKLANINVSGLNTSNVTNMSYMFSGCNVVKSLDLSSFDASKVTNLNTMFAYCSALTNLTFMNNLGKGYTSKSNNVSSYKLDLSAATTLTHDSLMSVINNLYDLNLTYDVANGGTLYTQQLILGSTNKGKLTADEIAIATNKGWVVS